MKKVNYLVLISCLIVVFLVAYIGSMFTSDSVNSDWYNSIKPAITPPNFVFPVVWTTLFVLIGLSLYLVWQKSKNKKKIILIYGLNFVLNIVWSYLYFGLRNPAGSFAEIFLLDASIVLMISTSWKIDKKAAWLLVPYLLWVTFAAFLNFLSI